MKNNEEMFKAFLAGEVLTGSTREYKLYQGDIWSFDFISEEPQGWIKIMKPPKPEAVEIKPKTVNINGFEVPEPITKLPTNPQRTEIVYCVNLAHCENVTELVLCEIEIHALHRLFNKGLLHSTKQAALAHAVALLSFTKKL